MGAPWHAAPVGCLAEHDSARATVRRPACFGSGLGRHLAAARTPAGAQSGQALLLAVVIMLLIVFLGSIFLRSVLANLRHAEHSSAASNEYAAAEAGIRFADTHLTSSELGADWRPRPYYDIARIASSPAGAFLQQDPDWYWIQPFNPNDPQNPKDDVGGYIRYNLGDSRFLLRVTYNPENSVYVRDASGNTIPGPGGRPLAMPVMPDVDPRDYDGGTTKFGPTDLSRYVMIEAIGRRGSAAEIDKEYQDYIDSNGADPIDPTVFASTNQALTNSGAFRFRRELVAFKAIGINNYLRFVTDRDRLGRPTYLGVDQSQIRDGDEVGGRAAIDFPFRLGIDCERFGPDFDTPATGSPIRVNGDLVWFGSLLPGNDGHPEVSVCLTAEKYNKVEVAGEIRREGPGQETPDAARMELRLYPPGARQGAAPQEVALPASDETAFEALVKSGPFQGRYLDNRWLTASPNEKPNYDPRRSVQRLEPPQIEVTDPASGVLRYQVISTAGAALADASNPWKGQAAGRYGYGAGMYLDNARHSGDHKRCWGDIQFSHDPERLRNEWLRPHSQMDDAGGRGGWKYPGRVYEPPAVIITLEPRDWSVPNAPAEGGLICVTRTDQWGWRDPLGNRIPERTLYFELRPGPVPAVAGNSREYTLLPKWWDGAAGVWRTWDWVNDTWVDYNGNVPAAWRYPFNGVIYAEGNVRIRGALPKDTPEGGVRLTVVSRGTIYIDGSLRKGEPAGNVARSQIALLARDYVCLNTTQFVHVKTDHQLVPSGDNGPPYFWRLAPNEKNRLFEISWDFGVPPNDPAVDNYYEETAGGRGYGPALYLRHQASGGPAAMQWQVNGPFFYKHQLPPLFGSGPQDYYPLLNPNEWSYFQDTQATPVQPFYLFRGSNPSSIPNGQNYTLNAKPGVMDTITIQSCDPGSPDGVTQTTGGDYNIGAVAIQPLDVMVTALIYAEHRSWFVIPGTFFQDTGDPEPAYAWGYPRNGEPLDVQIHVVGAIAEGQAASLDDVTQWTAHWRGANRTQYEQGNGSELGDSNFSRRGGIVYKFDPLLITDTRLVRYSDEEPAYCLPGVPRLPMCPGLVYFGERPVQ